MKKANISIWFSNVLRKLLILIIFILVSIVKMNVEKREEQWRITF